MNDIVMRLFSRKSVVLFFLIALNGFVLWRWMHQDAQPLSWDESIHMSVACDIHDGLARHDWMVLLKPATFNYPPIYHLTLALGMNVVKNLADVGAFVNFFYLVLLMVCVYFIGTHFLEPEHALTAAFLISCYPIIADIARFPMTDLALTAFVALGYLCLVKSEHFENVFWSLLFGVSVGLGMLIKWTGVFYLLGPLVLSLWHGLSEKRFKSIALSMALAGLLMLPWYSINLIVFMKRILLNSSLPPAGGMNLGAWNWLWYWAGLFDQLYLPFFLLLIPGLLVFFWKPKFWSLFLWFVVPMIFFTFLNNKNTRYTMPVLPAAALLSVAWLPPFRKIPLIIVNIIAALFFVTFHFFPAVHAGFNLGPVPVPILSSREPVKADWQHKAILDKIRELKDPQTPFARVLLLSNTPFFHNNSLEMTARSLGVKGVSFRGPAKKRWLELYEFILIKTGDLGPDFTIGTVKNCVDFVSNPPDWFRNVYQEAGRWPLPDGSQGLLLHASPKPQNIPFDGLFNLELGEFQMPNVVAQKVSFKAVPLSPAQTAVGRLKELDFACASLSYKDFTIENVSLRFIQPQLNVPLFLESQEIQLIGLARLQPRVTLNADTLLAYIAKKAKFLRETEVDFEKEKIKLKTKASGVPLTLQASVWVQGDALHTRLDSLTVAGIPLPSFLLQSVTNRTVALTPNDEIPFYLDIHSIQGKGKTLVIE